MPIAIPNDLPAAEILQNENIFVMKQTRAETQQIRPLEIVLLNLMPTKIVTEARIKPEIVAEQEIIVLRRNSRRERVMDGTLSNIRDIPVITPNSNGIVIAQKA